eukprot:32708-Prorocentrum_minimum.AAC.3
MWAVKENSAANTKCVFQSPLESFKSDVACSTLPAHFAAALRAPRLQRKRSRWCRSETAAASRLSENPAISVMRTERAHKE